MSSRPPAGPTGNDHREERSMSNPDVDEFVRMRVPPAHQETVATLRELMKQYAPDAREDIAYNIPVWRRKGILAVISPSKGHVTMSFSRGADFLDDHGQLQGVGKQTRHLKFKKASDVDPEILRDYVAQAVGLDN
jgi:hypothetical protein